MKNPDSNWREALLILITASAFLAAALLPPLAQDPAYHSFSDQRSLFDIPNFRNVTSSLAFFVVALFGFCQYKKTASGLRLPFALFCLSILLIAPGSAFYHWAPDNTTLVWDRLPMAVAFMMLFVLLIQSHVSTRLGQWLLWPLLFAGISSVLYWHWTEQHNSGDLRPYALVQYLPIMLIPLLLKLYPRDNDGSNWMWAALGFYLLAKFAEHADHSIFSTSNGLISGHSLKHLLAALGALLAIRAITYFTPADKPAQKDTKSFCFYSE